MTHKNLIKFIRKILRPIKLKLLYLNQILLIIPIRKINGYNSFMGQPVFDRGKGFVFWLTKNVFFSYLVRPKYAKDLNYAPSHSNYSSTGVCIQGPIGKNNKVFLENTILIYRKIFPNLKIVISTWKNEKNNISEVVHENSDEIILNEYPMDLESGIDNINFQTFTTHNGLKKLEELGCKFSIKQRADCRFYNPNSLSVFHNFFQIFSKTNNTNTERIFSCNIGSLKYRPYCLGDILLFGKTDDLLKYFHKEDYFTGLKTLGLNKLENPILNDVLITVENFLCSRYLKQHVGCNPNFTIEDWFYCLKKYFLIFDADQIDFIFRKKTPEFEKRAEKNYSNIDNESINFSDWLNCYTQDYNFWREDYKERWFISEYANYPRKNKRLI